MATVALKELAAGAMGPRQVLLHQSLAQSRRIKCNVGLALILGPAPLTIGPPEKWKLDVLNKGPTVLRAPRGLGDYFERDGLDSVPYF